MLASRPSIVLVDFHFGAHDMPRIIASGKPASKAEEAYTRLRNEILERRLFPGAPVSEIDIAERLGISRTPVREAIQRLKSENLVITIPGRGSFVKHLSVNDIKQTYELVEALEGMCSWLVTAETPVEEINKLHDYLVGMDEAFASPQFNVGKWLSVDEDFHLALYSMCSNASLVKELRRLNSQIHFVRMTMTPHIVDKRKSQEEHWELFRAMQAKDAEAARRMSQQHWHRVRLELMQIAGSI